MFILRTIVTNFSLSNARYLSMSPEEFLFPSFISPATLLLAVAATLIALVWATLRHPLRKLAWLMYLKWELSKRKKEDDVSAVSLSLAYSDDVVAVSALYIHPVKSLRAISVPHAELDAKGFVGDRRFMVVFPALLPPWKDTWGPHDSTHRFLAQRHCPSLARVVATVNEKDNYLSLTYDQTMVQVPLEQLEPKILYRAAIWEDQVTVEDMGDTAATFFQTIVDSDKDTSAAYGRYNGVRLVYHSLSDRTTEEYLPDLTPSWIRGRPPLLALTDEFPILIACQASLDELNRRLVKNGKPPIAMERFRPNIVISGTVAFEEDRWKYIAIGDQIFATAASCPRCKQTCIDPQTGILHAEPVKTLENFRCLNPKKSDVFFGITAIPLGRSGMVRVGDRVRILERGDPYYWG